MTTEQDIPPELKFRIQQEALIAARWEELKRHLFWALDMTDNQTFRNALLDAEQQRQKVSK